MKYNTTRKHLVLPEYGRNIQDMVDYTLTIEDKEEKNKAARSIVKLMEQMHPEVREIDDYQHKLWDHLHVMADYQLDCDSPYPKPNRIEFESKPDRVSYPSNNIRFRHYGKVIERMIEKATEYPEGEEKDALINTIANLMKRFYLVWNRDSVNDDDIWNHVKMLSGGKLVKPEGADLTDTSDILRSNKPNKKRSHKKNRKHRNR
ncbi:DUF4290 domain-containing protein [Salibacter halophilus]|uniref:DUF4290 domain-containing protein n=1 Tax=Salibacter halophilus TaxID=1803916 RepID=A0A6N6MB83_9FLAO|nr:DUF4290 domain-containing protein [Salibacter halophilus]KAB1066249.1 DUF4290 domain-containing protein [Salibacter halophilus]